MFTKETRSIEVKIVENKLQKIVAQAFSKSSTYHALLMAVYSAAIGAVEPFIQNWVNSAPEPSIKQIAQTVIGAVLITVIAYFTKNGANG